MINRNRKYLLERKTRLKKNGQKDMVQSSNDNKIDQDYPGFPHGHAKENIINPKTEKDKKTADVDNKDGEKMSRDEVEESKSDGSAGAFAATEEVKE